MKGESAEVREQVRWLRGWDAAEYAADCHFCGALSNHETSFAFEKQKLRDNCWVLCAYDTEPFFMRLEKSVFNAAVVMAVVFVLSILALLLIPS